MYEEDEMTAPIASGSFYTDGMIVMPCSMKSLAGIAAGYGGNLILRGGCLYQGRAEAGAGPKRNAFKQDSSQKYERGSKAWLHAGAAHADLL